VCTFFFISQSKNKQEITPSDRLFHHEAIFYGLGAGIFCSHPFPLNIPMAYFFVVIFTGQTVVDEVFH